MYIQVKKKNHKSPFILMGQVIFPFTVDSLPLLPVLSEDV